MNKSFHKIFLIILVFLFVTITTLAVYSNNIQGNISDKIIRLHIIANSNTYADQSLKLKVRDRVLKEGKLFSDKFSDVSSFRQALSDNLSALVNAAQDEITKNGYNYPVIVSLEKRMFPMKNYGNITLPSGEYDSINIKIGNAAGENWWCVMFPPLCFVNESINCNSKEILANNLTDNELSLISSDKGINIRFKTVDFFQNSFHTIKTALKK